ncbi:methyltransferase, partial [Candidatus Parvarchaeota archaeon]|nr:methyltransferase [Candidatus Parvarchaeota archaeon]
PSSVYEPSEDSTMLAIYSKKTSGKVLDVGCGCGIQAIACAKANPNSKVIGVDINPDAVFASRRNAENNNVKNCEFFISDMFYALSGSTFDWIIFNPPYLPTQRSEKIKGALNLAVDGGLDGRKVIDRFLGLFHPHLNKGGRLLMLDSSLDNTQLTVSALQRLGMQVRVLQKLSVFFETLSVLEATKP